MVLHFSMFDVLKRFQTNISGFDLGSCGRSYTNMKQYLDSFFTHLKSKLAGLTRKSYTR